MTSTEDGKFYTGLIMRSANGRYKIRIAEVCYHPVDNREYITYTYYPIGDDSLKCVSRSEFETMFVDV